MVADSVKPDLGIETIPIKKATLILRAINHKLRQDMLHHIHQKGRITVTELYIKLRLEQSVVSQHLAILRRAGYVTTQRQGKFIFYFVNYERIKEVHRQTSSLL
jgi:DNA-binding transcriptional ArsR family regulator